MAVDTMGARPIDTDEATGRMDTRARPEVEPLAGPLRAHYKPHVYPIEAKCGCEHPRLARDWVSRDYKRITPLEGN